MGNDGFIYGLDLGMILKKIIFVFKYKKEISLLFFENIFKRIFFFIEMKYSSIFLNYLTIFVYLRNYFLIFLYDFLNQGFFIFSFSNFRIS